MIPKFIAPADPATRWTAAHRGPAFFGYSTNYLINADNAIIVDVEATTAIRQAEILAAKRAATKYSEQKGRQSRPFSFNAVTYRSAGLLMFSGSGQNVAKTLPIFRSAVE